RQRGTCLCRLCQGEGGIRDRNVTGVQTCALPISSILWKDAKESERAAESMRITAQDLKELDVVDEIISEPLGGAHRNVEEQAAHIDRALTKSLLHFANSSPEELLEARRQKFSQIGKYIEG